MILCIAVRTTPAEPFGEPIRGEDGLYDIQAVYYREGRVEKAICGADVESIIVFDENFEVNQVLKPNGERE